MDVIADLRQGRDAHARNAWTETEEAFARADAQRPLGPHDLVLWAAAAYMLGRNEDHLRRYERAHHAYVAAGETLRAASCAIWMGLHLLTSGEVGRAGGWIARSQRLVERDGRDCVERGYLLMPAAFRHQAAGDVQAAVACCAAATAIAERFGDADLFALTVHTQGQMLVDAGRVEEGLRMLDEAMVAVIAGEVAPVASGIVYCGVIVGCRAAYEPRRAQEWTAALARWCERQPDMVAFSGRCLVHRAEIMQLHGAWTEALEEARRGEARCAASGNRRAAAAPAARQGDLLRLRGELDAAEDAYRRAASGGLEPQPGLALLRLAQGDAGAPPPGSVACWARRPTAASAPGCSRPPSRSCSPSGDLDAARRPRDELGTLARGCGATCSPRSSRTRAGASSSRTATRTPRCARCAGPGPPGGPRGAVRSRARARAARARLPRAGRRGVGRARARGGRARVQRARRGAGRRPRRALLRRPAPATPTG